MIRAKGIEENSIKLRTTGLADEANRSGSKIYDAAGLWQTIQSARESAFI
jgi:hypothetical protein